MADVIELSAKSRDSGGKGAARRTRAEGLIPAVIYGDKKPPETISMNYLEIWKQHQKGLFLSTVYTVDVDGKKTKVIPRDIQVDPVRDFPMHVDFLRLGKDARITVDIPVHFINEEDSPGIKRGGVLNIVRHDIELSCLADAIPESLTVDLDGLDIGDSVHISSIKLPEGTKPVISDRDFTIATIASASAGATDIDDEKPAEGEEAAAGEEGDKPKEGGDE